MTDENSFARLVSLACHDLRTPLATVSGFARTLTRAGELGEPASRYVEMIEAAAGQLAELLEELGLVARIEAGRYEPVLNEADTLELARAAARQLGEDRVAVSGTGGLVTVDLEATERAVAAFAQAALRHGGLEQVTLAVDGTELRIAPLTKYSTPVLTGEELRDLGAAVAARLVRALGGEVAVEDETLLLRLPQ